MMEDLKAKSSAAEALIEELMEENEDLKKEMRQMVDEMEELQDNFRWLSLSIHPPCPSIELRFNSQFQFRFRTFNIRSFAYGTVPGKIKLMNTAIWRRISNKRPRTAASSSSNCARLSVAWRRSKRRNTNWSWSHRAAPAAPTQPLTARIESTLWSRNWPNPRISLLRPSGNLSTFNRSWGAPIRILSLRPVLFSARVEVLKWVAWSHQSTIGSFGILYPYTYIRTHLSNNWV